MSQTHAQNREFDWTIPAFDMFQDKFSKMGHTFGKMLQIMVLLKNDHLVEKMKKQNIATVPHSSKKDQIFKIWHFHATTLNSDLYINNKMANKKMTKN